jgi:8-oxo-dGTP pyrophosphatase MutT (NUDIX family)
MMQFELIESKPVLNTVPFQVEEVHLRDRYRNGSQHIYHRLSCPDWVNVLPITADGQAILIRQSRVGPMKDVLETPGGVMDPGERDPTMTAVRELEEETGFSSQRILSLGRINPNPAVMGNSVHMFVALGCYRVAQRQHFPDDLETIEVVPFPVAELEMLVRSNQVDHALSALTIMLALKYLQK